MTTVAAPASPFKGLAPFGDSDLDALLFFGRARETEVIAANLQASRLTVLFGPSGVGKSSVIRAGVAHRLRQEPDTAVEIVDVWTGDAAAGVEEALRAQPEEGDLYVVLDQFEEYFVYHEDDVELPGLLADLVAERGRRVNVLIGIRDDSLARLDTFRRPIPNLLANRLRLDRLDRESARAAIVGPVERYLELTGEQVEVEPALVEEVLDQVTIGRVDLGRAGRGAVAGSDQTDRVEAPYLQLVLERLWEAERAAGSSRLRLETLERLGGAARIVRDHLEHAMADLTPQEREAAAAMYNHLVTPSGMKIAHRVADLAGYASVAEPEAARILGKLARERIVRGSSDDGPAAARYEIFHDVLADAVLAWRARHEEERALERAEVSRRRAHKLAAAALAGLVVVAAIAVFALLERGNARSQARRAHAEELAAKAVTLLEADPRQSLRLAYDAARLRPDAHEENVLRRALAADRLRETLRAQGPVRVAGFAPRGDLLVSGSADGNVRVYRRGSSTPLHVLRQEGAVTAAAFDPAGRRLLTAGADGTAKTWDARSGTLLQTMAAGGPVASASWARGGRVVVTGSTRGALRLWRARDGQRLRSFQAEVATPLAKAVVDPAATQVVTVSRDRFARVYSLATGHLTRSIPHGGFVGAVAFSPDGRLLLTADYTGAVRLWEARSGKLVRSLLGGQRNIPDAVFSPDGTRVAAASADGTARIWDVSTGLQMAIAIGRGANTAVAFNRDATAIVTTSIDGTARVWGAIPANGGRPLAVLTGHTGPVVAAGFSPDGRAVVTASEDGTARVWDPASEPDFSIAARRRSPLTALAIRSDRRRLLVGGADGIAEVRSADGKRVVRTLRLGHAVTAVAFGPQGAEAVDAPRTAIAFSPDGKLKAVAEGSTVRIASPTGPPSHTLRIGRIVHDLAFSPDGDDLAVALGNGTAQVWDAVAARRRLTLAGHKRPVVGIAFNSDGTLIATVSGQDVWLWDARTGEVMRKLQGPNARDVQFSPDGHWLVAAGPTTTALWELDVKTENVPGFLRASVERPFSAAGFGGPDGRLIIATSLDGTLRVFHCDLCGRARELLALAKRRIAAES